MRKKMILLMMITSFILMGGCDGEKVNASCYEGKIIALSDECFNVIEITSAPTHGIPIGQTIGFNPDLFNKELKEGSSIFIEITEFRKTEFPVASPCVYPTYTGIVKPCKH